MGRILTFAFVLLVALGVGGTVNYQRNEHLDAELQNRPYGKLSSDELELLLEAYRGEKAQIERQLQQVEKRSDPMERYAPGDLTGKLRAFEKVQRNASHWKQVRGEALEHEVEIERLEHEQQIRARGLDREWPRILRRITTF